MRKHFEHSVSQHLFGCQKSMLELDGVLYASGFMSRFHQRGLGLPHGLPEHIFWFPIRRHNSTSLTPERTTSAAVKCNFLRENFACPVIPFWKLDSGLHWTRRGWTQGVDWRSWAGAWLDHPSPQLRNRCGQVSRLPLQDRISSECVIMEELPYVGLFSNKTGERQTPNWLLLPGSWFRRED